MRRNTLSFVLATGLLIWLPMIAFAQEADTPFETSEERQVTGGADIQAGYEENATGEAAVPPAPATATASARSSGPPAGTVGIGGEGFLSGLVGLHLRYQISDTIGISGALRLGLGTFNPPMANSTAFELGAGLGLWVTFLECDGGRAGFVGSFDFDIRTVDFPDPLPTTTDFDFGIGAGLFAEIFPAPFFSLHAEAGLRIAIGGRDDGAGNANTAFGVGIGGDALVGFGFTFWFV